MVSVGAGCAVSVCAILTAIIAPSSSGHVYPVAEVAMGWKRHPAAWINRQVAVRGTIVYYTMTRGGLTNWQSSALPDAVPIGYKQIPAGYRAVVVVAPNNTHVSTTGMPVLAVKSIRASIWGRPHRWPALSGHADQARLKLRRAATRVWSCRPCYSRRELP